MGSQIEANVNDGIALVLLEDPGTRNAISLDMAQALTRLVREYVSDQAVHAVVLGGANGTFSSGGNLRDGLSHANGGAPDVSNLMMIYNELCRTLFHFPKPIISVVSGVAAGGALGIALCTDVILMERKARVSQAFIKIGLAPDCGSSFLLSQRVGLVRAKEMTLSGRPVGAEEALHIGLADSIHDEADIFRAAENQARCLSQGGGLAVMQSKILLQDPFVSSFERALALEGAVQASLLQSADFKTRAEAFANSRSESRTGGRA